MPHTPESPSPSGTPPRPRRRARALAVAGVALAAALAAATEVRVAGHWQGLFLLAGKGARPLELKDDLFLGDGSRLLAGASFSRARDVLGRAGPPRSGQAWLELEWDEASGSGVVRNHLGGEGELLTSFARYEDDEGNTPRGLFVGGALPDVARSRVSQNESGMSYRDERGWQHVWCNVNEGMLYAGEMTFPGAWRFLGSRVLIDDPERVVLESSHEIAVREGTLRMDRFAYFRAGKPWFKLGIRIANAGERPVGFAYTYGDEPWVGEFGSAVGNFGWVDGRIVTREGEIDPRKHRWAGVVDAKSGIANFISWMGDALPDRVYFANQPGSIGLAPGLPLSSNEVFIGLDWLGRQLQPGEQTSILLTIGLAASVPGAAAPALPEGAGPP